MAGLLQGTVMCSGAGPCDLGEPQMPVRLSEASCAHTLDSVHPKP